MANFNIAYKNTSKHEGGWTIDNGGWTYLGLSIKGHPKWPGWDVIKKHIAKKGFPKQGQYFPAVVHNTLQVMVNDYFKKTYWDKIYGDKITNQTLANFIYDFTINSGKAMLVINNTIGAKVVNSFTSDTLFLLNANPEKSYTKIYAARKNYYLQLIKKDASLEIYKNGWLSRLEKFPTELTPVAAASSVFFYPFWVI